MNLLCTSDSIKMYKRTANTHLVHIHTGCGSKCVVYQQVEQENNQGHLDCYNQQCFEYSC